MKRIALLLSMLVASPVLAMGCFPEPLPIKSDPEDTVMRIARIKSLSKKPVSFQSLVDGKRSVIPAHNVDKELRSLNIFQIRKVDKNGLLKQGVDAFGEPTIGINHELKGGLGIGASIGALAGKFLVSAAGHGTIYVISAGATLVGGPAVGASVFYGLESTCGAAIESASMAGAVGGGILLGTLTGPI